jgi:hypothetical protein
MRVLLDTHILLDVLLDRAPFVTDSSAIWAACDAGQIVGAIPASTLTQRWTKGGQTGGVSAFHAR